MRVRFHVNIQGVDIDHAVSGETPEQVVYNLRCALADTVVKKLFFRIRIGSHLPGLDPRLGGSWTDVEFFEKMTGYFNEHMTDGVPIACPATAREFLDAAEAQGMAVFE